LKLSDLSALDKALLVIVAALVAITAIIYKDPEIILMFIALMAIICLSIWLFERMGKGDGQP